MSEQKKGSRYTPAPKLTDEQLLRRYEMVVMALSGQLEVSEGARQLGMARNHFQTVMHRGMRGLVEGIRPKPAGRPAKPQREAELEAEVARLQAENAQLAEQNRKLSRVLALASDVMKGRPPIRRPRAAKKASTAMTESGPKDEPDGARHRLLRAIELRARGASTELAAALLDTTTSTVRRWMSRHRRGLPVVWRRGVKRRDAAPAAELARDAAALVRRTRGLIGADALRHAVPGLSRREAAVVKRQALKLMETERVARCERVHVTVPGVMRGMDQLCARTPEGGGVALVAADAALPFRTSAQWVGDYTGANVSAFLARDIEEHGAPLVYRMDRARSHTCDEVKALLAERGVLVLHGPARLPRFYGQLERQNREHRAWLPRGAIVTAAFAQRACDEMRACLNEEMPRRSLGWRTAAEAMEAWPALRVDRYDVLAEVEERAARMRENHDASTTPDDVIERMAIEAMLISRGWLIREAGGWC